MLKINFKPLEWYAAVHPSVHVCVRACVHESMCECVSVCMHACVSACVNACVCMYVCCYNLTQVITTWVGLIFYLLIIIIIICNQVHAIFLLLCFPRCVDNQSFSSVLIRLKLVHVGVLVCIQALIHNLFAELLYIRLCSAVQTTSLSVSFWFLWHLSSNTGVDVHLQYFLKLFLQSYWPSHTFIHLWLFWDRIQPVFSSMRAQKMFGKIGLFFK